MRSWHELTAVLSARPGDWGTLEPDEIEAIARASLLLSLRREPATACASLLRLRVSPAAVVVVSGIRTADARLTVDELAASWAPYASRTECWRASTHEAIACGLLTGRIERPTSEGLGASVVRPGPRLIPVLERRGEERQKLERFPW